MERLAISRQTLDEFVQDPFGQGHGQKRLEYETRYRSYRDSNRIVIAGTMELDGDYFVHVKVPSESQRGLSSHDVVIQFFTNNDITRKELTLKNYYVQFFSNSPGFVYKYAALYQLQGYLISSLQDKFTPGMLNVLPDKANKDYVLFYDSSIYYACRFLQDNRLSIFGKMSFKIYKHKSPTRFFRDIQDVETAEISRSVAGLEKNLLGEIKTDRKLSEQQERHLAMKNPLFRKEIQAKKTAQKSTFKDKTDAPSITRVGKTTGTKKRARQTTRKG